MFYICFSWLKQKHRMKIFYMCFFITFTHFHSIQYQTLCVFVNLWFYSGILSTAKWVRTKCGDTAWGCHHWTHQLAAACFLTALLSWSWFSYVKPCRGIKHNCVQRQTRLLCQNYPKCKYIENITTERMKKNYETNVQCAFYHLYSILVEFWL